ncbi:MAG: NADH-quinone oxidoreductase subunit NuoN [Magnetococcales bacterium]|nr:NADH-quinone oxidoreductase subunit NuoN [Magnetococcales bacterium]NGZ27208.1 NADH-quinone oxidoreductase subunit NuoN [Magnetococcales bacterium]
MPVQSLDMNLLPLLPEIFLSLAAMGLLLLGVGKDTPSGRCTVAWGSYASLALALLLVLMGGSKAVTSFNGLFVQDGFAHFMKIGILLAALLPLVISSDYVKEHKLDQPEYYVLTLFAALGGMVMASSGDFLTLYLGLELMSLSIYVLAAFQRDDTKSNEAGLKYFVLGSMASGILLYGISLLYGVSGTTTFNGLNAFLAGDVHHHTLMLHMGILFVIAGLAFKVAAAPFHMWAPDVYQGAPTSVTAFMAVMPKFAAFAAIYRVLLGAFGHQLTYWSPILQVLAIASLAIGAFVAIAQTNIKRMLAYSSIGHVGFILIGLAAGNVMGYQGVLLYLAVYLVMNVGVFAIIFILGKEGVGEEIDDYKGLAHKRPLMAFIMALFMFSMAGVPPLAGFIGKFYVFLAALNSGMMAVAIMGVLFSAVGAFYYLRIVKLMYFDEASREFAMPLSLTNRLVLAGTCLLILYWGIFPGDLMTWAGHSVATFK